MTPSLDARFMGLLSSATAQAVARHRLSHPAAAVQCWHVALERAAPAHGGGYAVRLEAQLCGGAEIATRARGRDLDATVREAFEGLDPLLHCGPAAARDLRSGL